MLSVRVRVLSLTMMAAAAVGGCTSVPSGPSVLALPGTGKPFDAFRTDSAECRQYAEESVGLTTPGHAGRNSAVVTAAAGTAVGAAAGALFGTAAGNPGAGAAIGAGSGLLIGSAAGANAYSTSANAIQKRYDDAYIGCMYAKGNQVPVPTTAYAASAPSYVPPPGPATIPPPPPSYPPPPSVTPPPPMSPGA